MVTDAYRADVVTDCFDDAGCFVPEQHRQWARPVVVDHREVGVADSCCAHADKDFAGPGGAEF